MGTRQLARRCGPGDIGTGITLERNPEKITLAGANLTEAGLAEYVDLYEGDAANTLVSLPGPFDFIFLDADRSQYLRYFELVFPKLASGGLLVADNVVPHAQELAAYLACVKSHSGLLSMTLPIGKGEEISIKLCHLSPNAPPRKQSLRLDESLYSVWPRLKNCSVPYPHGAHSY